MAGSPLAVLNCFDILDDTNRESLFELGCEVKGSGRWHIQSKKERVRRS
jgi:UDP-N-acetyl-D-glucosamine dehydrogenase